MRILITSIVDLKKSQHNRPHQFVKFLSKRHDVTIISINDWLKHAQNDCYDASNDFKDILKNTNYHYITEKKISPILQELFFRKEVKKIMKNEYDVHLNYNSLLIGNHFSKKYPTVFDIADDLITMIQHSPQIPFFLRRLGANLGRYYLNDNVTHAK